MCRCSVVVSEEDKFVVALRSDDCDAFERVGLKREKRAMVLEEHNALPGRIGGEVDVLLGTNHGHVDVGKRGGFRRIKPMDVIRSITRILGVFVRGNYTPRRNRTASTRARARSTSDSDSRPSATTEGMVS